MELTCSFNIRRNLIWFCLISASRTGSEWASGVDSPIFTLPDYYSTQLFTAPCVWEVGTFWGLLSKLCSQAHSRQVTIWFVNCEMFASAHLFETCIVFNGLFVNCFYSQANKEITLSICLSTFLVSAILVQTLPREIIRSAGRGYPLMCILKFTFIS